MFHAGIAQTLTIDGRRFTFSRFTRAILKKWIVWGLAQIENPWPDILASDLPLAALDVAEEQAARWKTLDNPALRTLYLSEAGTQKLLALLLEAHHPEEDPAPIVAKIIDPATLLKLASGYSIPTDTDHEYRYYVELGLMQDLQKPGVTNWEEIDRTIFQNIYLTPEQVDLMTLPEIMVVSKGKAESEDFMTIARNYTKLTEDQKKELALRKILAHVT